MIITRTPFRISFFGGGTDYPVWYRENPGAVLAMSINKYCYISCRHLPPFFDHKTRVVYSLIENVKKVSEIQHPAVRGCMKYMKFKEGLEIHHDADLPARAGLGSSSSFVVGLLHALHAMKGKIITKPQLALEAIHVEQDVIGENVGSQDQVIATYGGFNIVRFGGRQKIRVKPVTLTEKRLGRFQSHLMLFFTGLSRTASKIAEEQIRNTPGKKKELNTMLQLMEEAVSVLNSNKSLSDFGKILHENWLIKRSLSRRISTPLVDEIYEIARKAGALGGKLLGAGGGGFMLFYAPPSRHKEIRKKLKKLLYVPFQPEYLGSQIIFYSQDTPTTYTHK